MNTNQTDTSINAQVLKDTRLAQIRKLVEEFGQATVQDLSARFNVSEATIRRDLEEMNGLWLRRTHGGALRLERASKEPPVIQRVNEQAGEKARIGKAAAGLINAGETVFLGSGTTVTEVARAIPLSMHLTMITNSLPVVNLLTSRQEIDLIVIGGMLRQTELSMVGHVAEQAIREFRADKVIMGMRGIDCEHGLTNDFLPETMTDRAVLNIAPKVIIVADNTKFGKVSSVLVAPVTAAHTIVTDSSTSEDCLNDLRERGIEVILA